MVVQACVNIDEKLAKLYSEKVTVNLEDTKSAMSPDDFWKSMQVVASTNRVFLNIHQH